MPPVKNKLERTSPSELMRVPQKEFEALLQTLASPWFGYNPAQVRVAAQKLLDRINDLKIKEEI